MGVIQCRPMTTDEPATNGTHQQHDVHTVRAALNALRDVRAGRLTLPPDRLGRAMDILTAALPPNINIEHAISNGFDPDPRVGRDDPESFGAAQNDMDERERWLFAQFVRRLSRFSAAALKENPDAIRAMWAIARDSALTEPPPKEDAK